MPAPEQAVVCTVDAPDEDDLAPLIDALRPLLLSGTIQSNAMVGNALAVASMISDRQLWYDGPEAIPDGVVREICDGLEVGWWNARFAAGGFTLFPRHAIALALISFDKSQPEQAAAVRDVFPWLVADAAAARYAPCRANLAFMDLIADQYDLNDHAALGVQERVKDALDPNGVLSPGKQGIWPLAGRRSSRGLPA